MTPEEEEAHFDYEVLKIAANDGTGKMALQIGVAICAGFQTALERAQRREWIRLVDISPVAAHEGIFRIYLLTDQGWYRHKCAKEIVDRVRLETEAPQGSA